ncbi:hypothetical protein [Blastopirellula marina]|uniref:Uncharacterized protein n=1 Tax=Blastopirellula marina DSM 3645 TaxID=314230 RepID=A4A300_9BACT|nr:hypothetical protein [Blastopirellula marina]EAQ76860.1 hypothetical protein DSM3645_15800 [Blastopirellula marina DSM 3645]
MQRIYTQLLVWMVVVSLFAATPLACMSALTVSAEIAAVAGKTNVAASSSVANDSQVDPAEHRIDRLFYFPCKTEEESRDACQHAKHFSSFVDSLPGVQSVAARQLLHSANRTLHAAPSMSRPLRL